MTTDEHSSAPSTSKVLYKERQWIPPYWWIFGILLDLVLAGQIGHNRSSAYTIVSFIIAAALTFWFLYSLCGTKIRVEEDPSGVRWLIVGKAQLPHDVVSRSWVVPAESKRSVMGPQLDPAAFVMSHSWVKEMVLLVLDDPEDPTPYWVISTQDPRAVLETFVPQQAADAQKSQAQS